MQENLEKSSLEQAYEVVKEWGTSTSGKDSESGDFQRAICYHVWRWWCPTSCLGKPWIHDDSCHSWNARPSHGFSAKGKPLDLGGLGDGGVSSLLRNHYINLLKQVEAFQHSTLIRSSVRNAKLTTNNLRMMGSRLWNVGILPTVSLAASQTQESVPFDNKGWDPAETLEDGRWVFPKIGVPQNGWWK